MREANFFKEQDNLNVKCFLCPSGCIIKPNETGFCKVRKNEGGLLKTPYYGMVSSISLDPIEKKPLYRYKPMSKILSLGGYSCNLRCGWCQNYEISMIEPEMKFYSPEIIAKYAKTLEEKGNIGVAYTYSEPLIHYEYVLDCAVLVKNKGLDNVLITNGYINEKPLRELLPYIDAMNIDLKGFTKKSYTDISGSLEHVKNTIEEAVKYCHVEVTALIIPGINDSFSEMEEMSEWLSGISCDIPLHITRFFPRYKMEDKAPTERGLITDLRNIALKRLKYVYAGNMG